METPSGSAAIQMYHVRKEKSKVLVEKMMKKTAKVNGYLFSTTSSKVYSKSWM